MGSGNNNSLDVVIRTLADTNGVDQVEASLRRVSGMQGANAAATGEAAGKQKELNETEHEGGIIAETLHKNHRAVHQVLHIIGHEAGPAVAGAFAAIAAAASGGMMLAIFAVKELLEFITKTEEKAERLKELLEGGIDLTGLVKEAKEVADNMGEATRQVEEFFNKIHERTSKSATDWKKLADEEIAHYQRVNEEEKKLAAAESERDKARLDYLKSTHQISEADYQKGVAAADALKSQRGESADANLKERTQAELSQALTNIIAEIERDRRTLQGDGSPAMTAAEQKSRLEQLTKHIETLKGEMEAARKKMEELEKAQAEATPGFGEGFLQGASDNDNDGTTISEQKQEEIGNAMNELRAYEAGIQSAIESAKREIEATKVSSKAAEDKVKELEQRVNDLEKDKEQIDAELLKRKDEAEVHKQHEGSTEAANTETRAYRGETYNRDAKSRPDDPRNQMAANNAVMEQLAKAATEAAQTHNGSLQAILKSIEDLRKQNKDLAQRLNNHGL